VGVMFGVLTLRLPSPHFNIGEVAGCSGQPGCGFRLRCLSPRRSYIPRVRFVLRRGALGDSVAAVAALAPLVDSHPDDYDLFLQLGWLYFLLEDFESAEAHYTQASTLCLLRTPSTA